MEREYKCEVYRGLKAFAVSLLVFMLVSALIIYVSVELKSTIIGAVGFLVLFITPIVLQKKIKDEFTTQVLLEFNEDAFSILTYRRSGEPSKKMSYDWQNIKSYKFYFTPSNLTCLDIYFVNGGWKEFAFKDGKDQEEATKSENDSIFNIFRSFAKAYNYRKMEGEKINLKPGFLTTKLGTNLLWPVGFLALAAITVIAITNSSSFAFLFIGLFAYLPLLAKRRTDKAFYEKMRSLD